jgi:hypothetical protein
MIIVVTDEDLKSALALMYEWATATRVEGGDIAATLAMIDQTEALLAGRPSILTREGIAQRMKALMQ